MVMTSSSLRSDAPVEDLVVARRGVEVPLAAAHDDGNRERPVVTSDDEGRASRIVRIDFDRVLHSCLRDEGGRAVLVLDRILGGDQVLAVGPEDREQGRYVVGGGRLDQRIRGFLRRRECLLCRGLARRRCLGGARDREDDREDCEDYVLHGLLPPPAAASTAAASTAAAPPRAPALEEPRALLLRASLPL